jgi:hypothetical protein
MRGLGLLAALVLVTAVTALVGAAASLGVTTAKLTFSTKALAHGSCTLGASATSDSFADENAPTTTNGSATTLDVRQQNNRRRYTFIKFDASSCNFPSGATVDAATLTMNQITAPGSSRTYDVYRVTGSWAASTLNWSNQPSVAASATASVTIPTTTGAISIPVTADAAEYLAGTATNNGWRISDAGSGNASSQFASAENATAANRPSLTITYAS